MSMYPGHNSRIPPHENRLNELFDQIRAEFNTHVRASETSYEHQIGAQVQEIQMIREKVYGMEQTHMTMKQKYEEEIANLRRQISELRAGGPPQGAMGHPQHSGPAQQPPPIAGGSGLFNGIVAGGGQASGMPPPPPSQQEQMGPHGQMSQGAPPPSNLPGPPPPPPGPAGQPPFQQYPPNGIGPQPPQSTASPGPGRRGIGRPPGAVGPATPQINTPIPYVGATQSPQVSHPTPTGPSMAHHAQQQQQQGSFTEMNFDQVPTPFKKQQDDWLCIFNQAVPRNLDVDLVHTLQHDSVVCCVRFSRDGKYVATGCNRSAQIYDVQTGEKLCVLQDENAESQGDLYIRSVCFSPNGRYLATGAEDKLIRVWDIEQKMIRCTFAGHDQDIYSLDFAADGRTIASGSGDRTVRLWDIEQNTHITTLTIEDGVTTVAISPDTKYVAAGSLDKSVRVWDLHAGYLLERLEGPDGHKDSVYSVAFSPNGQDLVSGSLDKTIKLWELSAPRGLPNPGPKNAHCLRTFEGHKDFVLSVALTPDAKWVMSGSKDRQVQFWDPRTGASQLMLQGHKNSVISVAPSPTGGFFATGSGDTKARIWSYRTLAPQ